MARSNPPRAQVSYVNQSIVVGSLLFFFFLALGKSGQNADSFVAEQHAKTPVEPYVYTEKPTYAAPKPTSPDPKPSPVVVESKTPTASPVASPVEVTETKKPAVASTLTGNDSITDLQQNFRIARANMVRNLQKQYGDVHYHAMFVATDSGRSLFKSANGETGGVSWERVRKRMQLKLLSVLDVHVNDTAMTNKFVWGTGGHSSTAGHGNLFDESYTAVLERHVQQVFAAVGVEFDARNFAMGGTSSTPETALCLEEIYGNDPDVMIWDFGMTEAGVHDKLYFYIHRVSQAPNRPSCLIFHQLERDQQWTNEELIRLQENGASILYSDEAVLDAAEKAVPDSEGLELDAINDMPPFVRNYHCGQLVEMGDPFCAQEKYNETVCSDRKFKASWHQGWKWHAIQGVHAALFLTEQLDQAITELTKSETTADLAESIINEEKSSVDKLKEAPLTSMDKIKKDITGDINWRDIVTKPTHCHPGRVPADIRHRGILTGDPPGDMMDYPEGVPFGKAKRQKNEGGGPLLVATEEDRQTVEGCSVQLNMDHKDFFLYSGKDDDWKTLVWPSDAAKQAYGRGQNLLGLVALCLVRCPWGRCEPGELREAHIGNGTVTMEVNGSPVTNVTQFDDCVFLKGEDGHYWTPTEEGQISLRGKVNEVNSFLRVSAFIAW